jgi:NAD(P)-dependent dehydrogenase (short-subunit alcohol dehydrogenase family)
MKNCVLIPSCSSGTGRATAFHFCNKGWRVVATMLSPEEEVELTSFSDIWLNILK